MTRTRAVVVLAVVAAISAGCGNNSAFNGAKRAYRRALAPIATAVSSAAKHAVAHASTQRYRNDADHDRRQDGDADGDISADDDKDPTSDRFKSNYKPGENHAYHDTDDSEVLTSGQPASSDDEQVIATAVRRYYASAAAEDGASACAQLTPSLAATVVSAYGQEGPSYLHAGKTCATVLELLFRHYHRQLAAGVTVTGVRVSGDQAFALLGSTAFPASFIIVQRESAGMWRLAQLLGNENKLG